MNNVMDARDHSVNLCETFVSCAMNLQIQLLNNLQAMIRQQRGDDTQQAFADRIGVAQSQISKWEKGESVPHLKQVEALAADLGILPEEYVARLYGRTINPETIVDSPSPLEQLLKEPEDVQIKAALTLIRATKLGSIS